jgi:hypothetical protein
MGATRTMFVFPTSRERWQSIPTIPKAPHHKAEKEGM